MSVQPVGGMSAEEGRLAQDCSRLLSQDHTQQQGGPGVRLGCAPTKGKPGFGGLLLTATKRLLPTFQEALFLRKCCKAPPDVARSRQNCFVLPRFVTGEKLVPGAREVLTEIFKSCAHSEQMLSLTPAKPIKVSDIYLSKEQINSQTPGNLLHLFFTNVRPPKKVLEDQLTQVDAPPRPAPRAGPQVRLGLSPRTLPPSGAHRS